MLVRTNQNLWLPPVGGVTSVRFDADGDEFTRTTNLPVITNFTICGWLNWTGAVTTNARFQTVMELAIDDNNTCYLQTGGSDITPDGSIGVWKEVAGVNGGYNPIGLVPTLGTWYYVAMVGSGNVITGYAVRKNGSYTSGTSTVAATFTPTIMRFGESAYTAEWFNGRLAAYKVYDIALSIAEIKMEMQQYVPYRTLNLNSWFPFNMSSSNLVSKDAWIYRRNLTVGGTLTFENGPPVPWQLYTNPKRRYVDKANAAVTASYPGYYAPYGWY